jgi:hypothetical protein
VHRAELPTALASPSDHYLVLYEAAGGGTPDVVFMAVADAATAGGVPDPSPLRGALGQHACITPTQAVAALGEAVHGNCVGAILDRLADEGAVPTGGEWSYGSAFSGVDVAASAVAARAAASGLAFRYAFASEREPPRRRVLLRAWGPAGLTEPRLYGDARDPAARREERVHTFVITPVCQPFSPRNRARSAEKQARALADVHAALDYVRFARPAVVIVENVEHAELHAHMDMMLLGIAGYAWRSVVVDPRDVGGFAARRRRYWVGVRAT